MVIRRNSKRDSNSRRPLQKGQQRERRGLFLENLEDRRLLHGGGQHVPISGAEVDPDVDTGFEIIGAQLNNGDILNNGDVLNQSPRDITLHFAPHAPVENFSIDVNSLDGISLLRTGPDGQFGRAAAVSDLGSNGELEMTFTSLVDSVEGNAIELVFTRSDHENETGPRIEVEDLDDGDLDEGDVHIRISIDLNGLCVQIYDQSFQYLTLLEGFYFINFIKCGIITVGVYYY